MISTQGNPKPLAALALKTVGIIIILSALVDMFILPYPYKWGNLQWQIATTAQIVDRGLVPMVGLALLLTGYWVSGVSGGETGDRKTPWLDLRFWAAIFAGVLGVMYIILFFLHLNNVRLNFGELQGQLAKETEQAQVQLAQVDTQVQTRIGQLRGQINQLVNASDAEISQAVQAKIINEQQANQIRSFKQNPASIEPFLQQQAQQLQGQAAQAKTELQSRQQQAKEKIFDDALKSGLRIGIGSLLLGVGYLYIIVGWVNRMMNTGLP